MKFSVSGRSQLPLRRCLNPGAFSTGCHDEMDAVTLHGGSVERKCAIEDSLELKAAHAVKMLKF